MTLQGSAQSASAPSHGHTGVGDNLKKLFTHGSSIFSSRFWSSTKELDPPPSHHAELRPAVSLPFRKEMDLDDDEMLMDVASGQLTVSSTHSISSLDEGDTSGLVQFLSETAPIPTATLPKSLSDPALSSQTLTFPSSPTSSQPNSALLARRTRRPTAANLKYSAKMLRSQLLAPGETPSTIPSSPISPLVNPPFAALSHQEFSVSKDKSDETVQESNEGAADKKESSLILSDVATGHLERLLIQCLCEYQLEPSAWFGPIMSLLVQVSIL
jgi:hypothetical protein